MTSTKLDTFTAAATGDGAAQEALARTVLGDGADPFSATDVALWASYMWANMALINRRLTVRALRIDILMAMAARSITDAPGRARDFLVDALATLYEFETEENERAAASIEMFMPTLVKDFDPAQCAAIIEDARTLATRRVIALVDSPAGSMLSSIMLH